MISDDTKRSQRSYVNEQAMACHVRDMTANKKNKYYSNDSI